MKTGLSQVQSAFAVVHWENTIVDEFEGLATLLKTWYPADADDLGDADIGDSSARRRRQAEITSPLPPGHYRPQLFRCALELKLEPSQSSPRYSETSKQIYLIDVDQRTLFSLQAVINDSVMVILQIMIEQLVLVVIGDSANVEQLVLMVVGGVTCWRFLSTSSLRCSVRRASLSRCLTNLSSILVLPLV